MYDAAIDGMVKKMLMHSTPSGLSYIADYDGRSMVRHKMDHLACFMAGTMALGAATDPLGIDSPRAQRDLQVGKSLAYTCYQMYQRMPTGIAPEYVTFAQGRDLSPGPNAAFYILRPETVESLYYLNQLTGDPIYREWGWEIFQSIEKHCKTTTAYGALPDVRSTSRGPEDRMESFFLAETLKYFYLLFVPKEEGIDLMEYVFNTEAHPQKIMGNDGEHL